MKKFLVDLVIVLVCLVVFAVCSGILLSLIKLIPCEPGLCLFSALLGLFAFVTSLSISFLNLYPRLERRFGVHSINGKKSSEPIRFVPVAIASIVTCIVFVPLLWIITFQPPSDAEDRAMAQCERNISAYIVKVIESGDYSLVEYKNRNVVFNFELKNAKGMMMQDAMVQKNNLEVRIAEFERKEVNCRVAASRGRDDLVVQIASWGWPVLFFGSIYYLAKLLSKI